MDEIEVRGLIETKLRCALPDPVWDFLVEDHYLSEYLSAPTAALLDEMTQKAKRLLALREPGAPMRGLRSPPNSVAAVTESRLDEAQSLYQHALSEAVASVADRDPDVLSFRADVLGSQLLDWPAVDAWIQRQEAEQGEPTEWVTFSLPRDHASESVTYDELLKRASGVEARVLRYVTPDGDWPKLVATVAGCPLERLRLLSERLAPAYAWDSAQAAVYVLTGITPVVHLLRTTDGGTQIRHQTWCAWAEQITLKVNPAVSPEQVATAYRAARHKYAQSRTEGRFKIREQSKSRLRLAGFVARRRSNTSWADLMRDWNSICAPEERYRHISNFRRDAGLAVQRLLYRGLIAPAGR